MSTKPQCLYNNKPVVYAPSIGKSRFIKCERLSFKDDGQTSYLHLQPPRQTFILLERTIQNYIYQEILNT